MKKVIIIMYSLLSILFFNKAYASEDIEYCYKHSEIIDELVKWVSDLGDIYYRNVITVNSVSDNEIKNIKRKNLSKYLKCADIIMPDSMEIYKAINYYFERKENFSKKIIKQSYRNKIYLPEFLDLNYRILKGRIDLVKGFNFGDYWGLHIPLSVWGKGKNLRTAPLTVRPNPPIPDIPHDRVDLLLNIGKLFLKMKYRREAINLFIEAYYSSQYFLDPDRNGELWLRIAELEEQEGQAKLAIRAYLKAAYLHKSYIKKSSDNIKRILFEPNRTAKKRIKPLNPKLEKNEVKKIIAFYNEMNLHPISLSLIKRFKNEEGIDLKEEKKKTTEEWEKILKRNLRARNPNAHVLDQKITEVKDWSKIKIMRPSDSYWKPVYIH